MKRSFLTAVVALVILAAGALVPQRSAPVAASGAATGLVSQALNALVSGPAAAQRARKRSLMSILFGRRKARRRAVKRRRATPRRATRRKARRAKQRRAAKPRARVKRRTARTRPAKKRRKAVRRAAAPAAAAAAGAAGTAAVASREDATTAPAETKKVMVIGDFYAGGLAFGLARALDEESGIVVDKQSSASSGLIRDDVVDWPKRIGELAKEIDPDYIILQLGSNDRQLLRTANGKFKPRSEEWDRVYKERIGKVADALNATGKPFMWVGVPPVRFKSMNRDFLVFNDWYAEAAKEAGGKFVDVWDGFTDADGNYTRSGPDVSGRIVVLRGKDGINMTTRGKDKLAWYATATVEKALAGPTVFTSLPTIDLGSPQIAKKVYNPARTGRTIVVKLDDPAVDGTAGLAGAGQLETSEPATVDAVPSGRADDFAWPAGR